jgi:hypothetical protein
MNTPKNESAGKTDGMLIKQFVLRFRKVPQEASFGTWNLNLPGLPTCDLVCDVVSSSMLDIQFFELMPCLGILPKHGECFISYAVTYSTRSMHQDSVRPKIARRQQLWFGNDGT